MYQKWQPRKTASITALPGAGSTAGLQDVLAAQLDVLGRGSHAVLHLAERHDVLRAMLCQAAALLRCSYAGILTHCRAAQSRLHGALGNKVATATEQHRGQRALR